MGLKWCPDWTRRQYGPMRDGCYSATIPSARFGHASRLSRAGGKDSLCNARSKIDLMEFRSRVVRTGVYEWRVL
jgi:hypothetical protein